MLAESKQTLDPQASVIVSAIANASSYSFFSAIGASYVQLREDGLIQPRIKRRRLRAPTVLFASQHLPSSASSFSSRRHPTRQRLPSEYDSEDERALDPEPQRSRPFPRQLQLPSILSWMGASINSLPTHSIREGSNGFTQSALPILSPTLAYALGNTWRPRPLVDPCSSHTRHLPPCWSNQVIVEAAFRVGYGSTRPLRERWRILFDGADWNRKLNEAAGNLECVSSSLYLALSLTSSLLSVTDVPFDVLMPSSLVSLRQAQHDRVLLSLWDPPLYIVTTG
ncbi:hypothetical protein NMY22_g7546 [Coprinellus aureogranulatus]|nr:hypothetical protein NMY22_g7546 [Coprinellus aureogranulatus]